MSIPQAAVFLSALMTTAHPMNAQPANPAIANPALANLALANLALANLALANLDGFAQQTLANSLTPGFSFVVEYKGKPVFAKGYGLSDIAKQAPVTPDTRFAIGSVSKQFVAVSILKLAEEGKLSLDDPLARYLPTLPNAPKITVRMLLNQTSGLHNYPNTREHPWPTQGSIAPEALFAIMATDTPNFEPGTLYEYSNTNYAALAGIVAKVSGISLAEFLAQRIFKPLGMTASGSGFEAQPGIALAYDGLAPYQRQDDLSLDLFYGAGSIVSTANDLARWDDALLHGAVLKPESMRLLWTAGALPDGKPNDYAMGFVSATLDGHREVWHNGLTPGAGGYCYNAIFLDDDLAVVILSNGAKFMGQPEALVKQTLEAFFPPVQPASTPIAATVAPKEDPAVTALARKLYVQFMDGKVDTTLFTPTAAAAFTPALLAKTQPVFRQLGQPKKLLLVSRRDVDGGTAFNYLATFEIAELHLLIVIAPDGKVAGYRILQ
jgi:CubicO group peptidase (beta-lactamase class C family)